MSSCMSLSFSQVFLACSCIVVLMGLVFSLLCSERDVSLSDSEVFEVILMALL